MQVKYEINELKARKDEELEHIILRNRYFGRSDRDPEKRIDEIEKSRTEKENELKNLFGTDNELINLLLESHETLKDLNTVFKTNKNLNIVDNNLINWLLAMYNNVRDKYSRLRVI